MVESLNLHKDENENSSLFTLNKCPEILCSIGNTDYLQRCLIDSGAMGNILPYDIFSQHFDTSKLVKLSHDLSLVGPTGSFSNAILGVVNTNIFNNLVISKVFYSNCRQTVHSKIYKKY